MRRTCANCKHDEMAHNLDPMTLIAWCVNRATCRCPQFQPQGTKADECPRCHGPNDHGDECVAYYASKRR